MAEDAPAPAIPPVTTTAGASVINTNVLLKPPAFVPHDMPVSQPQCLKYTGWMKANWEEKAVAAVQNTPFDQELLYAIACQETAERWGIWD